MARRIVVPLAILVGACVFQGVRVEPVARPAAADVDVRGPVKAHLLDGTTVVFLQGVQVTPHALLGDGFRYDLALHDSAAVTRVPLDSVVAMETFRTHVDVAPTVIVSVLATGVIAVGSVVLAKAIFGSCPTFYADSSGDLALEAEGFSYSIAPLFEGRDVDRLRATPAAGGTVRLEVRNEALETHYLNHLELLEVRHAPADMALVDQAHRPLVVGNIVSLSRATDRRGRDVRAAFLAPGGESYRTDPRTLNGARLDNLDDAVEIAAPVPSGVDSVAVVLRLRNSLLNTILLYDVMLGDAGARSLDWVGRELEQIGPAVQLGQWYERRMGMRIAVLGPGGYREVAQLKDAGPIAWKDVAVVVPVLEQGRVRLRLTFPMDNWRIDRVSIGTRVERVESQSHPLAEVRNAAERSDTTALAALVRPDGRYLSTSPGQRFTIAFETGSAAADVARTFFLASQGYYTEWMRHDWLAAPRTAHVFVPSDAALLDAMGRWRIAQDTLEARFMATRIPVR